MKDSRTPWTLALALVAGCGLAVAVWLASGVATTNVPADPEPGTAQGRSEVAVGANAVGSTTQVATRERMSPAGGPVVADNTSATTGLIVRVSDEERQPVAGIAVSWVVDSDPGPRTGTTGTNGVFLTDWELGHAFRVTVAGQTKVACNQDGPARVDFVVGSRRRIEVRASTADGTPVAAAAVLLGSKVDAGIASRVAETGPDGMATLSSFDRRDVVWVDKAGWRCAARLPVTAASSVPGPNGAERVWQLDFVLEPVRPADFVDGRVINEAGRPVPDVAVRWFVGAGGPRLRYRSYLAEHPAPIVVRSDAAGRFSLPMAGERGRLHAHRDGFADVWLDLDPSAYELDDLEVVLPDEAVIRGVVLGQAGSPAAGAQVEARVGEDQPIVSITDAAGRFQLRGVRASQGGVDSSAASVALCAFHSGEGHARQQVAMDKAVAGGLRLNLAGNLLTGVIRRGGRPMAGARVRVVGTIRSWRGAGWDPRGYDATTGDDGRFVLVRPEGRWSLVVEPEDERQHARAPLRFPGAGLTGFVDIDLDEAEQSRGTVRLLVSGGDGRPLDSYWLRLFPRESKGPAISVFCASADGRLEASIPAGAYRVAISPRGGSLMQDLDDTTVVAGAVRDLGRAVVAPATVVSGLLEPGGPDAGIGLVATIEFGGRSPTISRWNGGFGRWEMPYLAPGHYTVAPGRRSQIHFDAFEIDVVAGENPDVRIIGYPGWRGRVHVLLPDNASGPWVLEYANCKGEPERRTFDATGAHNGRVAIPDVYLVPGQSRLLVGPADGLLRSFTVTPTQNFLRVDAR